ncbi:MAG TPA: OpgC domain-containing protein [Trinickia sp.]|nr:OpgC domain-containing protein [Trinickia sp.]
MQSQRLPELDFFRGIALLVIVVDHVGGSILSRFTLHTYAFNDAAEVFVFLGGYATATAYASLAARHGVRTARQRFVQRAGLLYRAFLLTAALMLVLSAALGALRLDAPNLASADLQDFVDAPLRTVIDVASFQRQPYLASILPMYVAFALATPIVVPLAQRTPWRVLIGSTAMWGVASLAARWLPSADQTPWDFNPLAWQLIFVLGVLVRCQPIYQRVQTWRAAKAVSVAALTLVIGLGWAKLSGVGGLGGYADKPNLDGLRVANFLAMSWLAADLTRQGWIGQLARRLRWIGEVGRDGLASFIAGAAISLVIDSVLYATTDGLLHVPLGLAADAVAIGALFAVTLARRRRASYRAAAVTA